MALKVECKASALTYERLAAPFEPPPSLPGLCSAHSGHETILVPATVPLPRMVRKWLPTIYTANSFGPQMNATLSLRARVNFLYP